MCTMIALSTRVEGMAKGPDGWFKVTQATVGYDHATHSNDEHALLLDFTNYDVGPGARVGVELDLASARALVTHIQSAIDQAQLVESA